MQEVIIEILNRFGYIGVFLLIFIENIFPPIPSEVILTFGGFMTTYSQMEPFGVVLAATIGSVAGALVLYGIGRVLSAERLERLIDGKLGKMLHLKKSDIQRAEGWFVKRGHTAIFFCRFVPIVRSLISIPAGVTRMGLGSFLPLTLVGTFIWNLALVFLGRIAGNAWATVAHYFDIYSLVAAVLFVLLFAAVVIVFIKKRF